MAFLCHHVVACTGETASALPGSILFAMATKRDEREDVASNNFLATLAGHHCIQCGGDKRRGVAHAHGLGSGAPNRKSEVLICPPAVS